MCVLYLTDGICYYVSMNAEIIKKIKEAKDTYSFYLKPEKNIKFSPGQFIYITLPVLKYPDKRGSTRHFTIASSPSDKKIMFTTRIRQSSGFKKTLVELKKGEIIEINGPNGTFIVDENEKGPHVFIAGGIGITPYMSMLNYKIKKGLKYKATLIYSNTTKEATAFEKELNQFAEKDKSLSIFYTLTRETPKSWKGQRGRVDKKMLQDILITNEVPTSHFWISGPPAMVDSMEKAVESLGVNPDNIRIDKFSGY